MLVNIDIVQGGIRMAIIFILLSLCAAAHFIYYLYLLFHRDR